jgi:hypothetical protein
LYYPAKDPPVLRPPLPSRQVLLGLTLALFPGQAATQEPVFDDLAHPAGSPCAPTTLRQLQRLRDHELERLFAQAEAPLPPVGYVRGQVLTLEGFRFPRVGVKLTGLVWKGKHFDEEGRFINQWNCFKALHSRAAYGPSWFDGGPCLVLEYPPGTPLFANMRDEVRQVGPCLYLIRAYSRSPQPQFRGFVGLQADPDRRRPCH